MWLLLIIIGLFTIICSILKPNFYWESRKALTLRNIIGDKATSIVYIAVGVFVLCCGIIYFIAPSLPQFN